MEIVTKFSGEPANVLEAIFTGPMAIATRVSFKITSVRVRELSIGPITIDMKGNGVTVSNMAEAPNNGLTETNT